MREEGFEPTKARGRRILSPVHLTGLCYPRARRRHCAHFKDGGRAARQTRYNDKQIADRNYCAASYGLCRGGFTLDRVSPFAGRGPVPRAHGSELRQDGNLSTTLFCYTYHLRTTAFKTRRCNSNIKQ